MNEIKIRYHFIDQLRGIALILMIFFHASYDLNLFGFIQVNMISNFWFYLPRVIVFLFLLCVGMSLAIAHNQQQVLPKAYWTRLKKILSYAIIISLFTFFAFPKNWIYFGTLHCIAFCTFAAIPLIKRPKVALFLCLAMISSLYYFNWSLRKVTISPFAIKSMDYIPPYPWFAVCCLGIYLGTVIKDKKFNPNIKAPALSWLGQKSLIIYLIHQPLLFSMIYIARQVIAPST